MIAGCYALDLYCRHQEAKFDNTHKLPGNLQWMSFPAQFTGQTEGECKKQARQRGWVFNKDGEVTCPKCAK